MGFRKSWLGGVFVFVILAGHAGFLRAEEVYSADIELEGDGSLFLGVPLSSSIKISLDGNVAKAVVDDIFEAERKLINSCVDVLSVPPLFQAEWIPVRSYYRDEVVRVSLGGGDFVSVVESMHSMKGGVSSLIGFSGERGGGREKAISVGRLEYCSISGFCLNRGDAGEFSSTMEVQCRGGVSVEVSSSGGLTVGADAGGVEVQANVQPTRSDGDERFSNGVGKNNAYDCLPSKICVSISDAEEAVVDSSVISCSAEQVTVESSFIKGESISYQVGDVKFSVNK